MNKFMYFLIAVVAFIATSCTTDEELVFAEDTCKEESETLSNAKS